jgi:hypothetical protein
MSSTEAMNTTDISTDAVDLDLSRELTIYIKDEPVKSLAIATAAGFVFGGGLNNRLGLAMITMGTRMALRGFCGYALTGAVISRSHQQGGQVRAEHRQDRAVLRIP